MAAGQRGVCVSPGVLSCVARLIQSSKQAQVCIADMVSFQLGHVRLRRTHGNTRRRVFTPCFSHSFFFRPLLPLSGFRFSLGSLWVVRHQTHKENGERKSIIRGTFLMEMDTVRRMYSVKRDRTCAAFWGGLRFDLLRI